MRPTWTIVLVSCLSTVVGCRGDDAAPPDEGRGIVVQVATVRTGDLRDVANASGMVVPSTAADLTVFATEAAEIVELPRKANDVVAVGDVLVRYEIDALTQELAALQLQVLEATTRLDRARADMTRQDELFGRGLTPRNSRDSARLDLSAAEGNLAAAKARLEALQASQDRAVVRAGFAGVVVEVWHAEGDVVRPDSTDPILRVVDPTRLQVAVQLPIPQLARVVAGQSAIVRAIAGAADEPATVATKSQTIDPGAPTGEVRLSFVNPSTLPVNTPVSVEILLDQRTSARLVPAEAVARDDLGAYVMVAGDDNVAYRREVRVGLVTPQLSQILSGVENGERVILPGAEEIFDRTPIVISR